MDRKYVNWIVVIWAVVSICCFGLGMLAGYTLANEQSVETSEPTITETAEEAIETEPETIPETEPIVETTEATEEETEPVETTAATEAPVVEAEYIEPEPTETVPEVTEASVPEETVSDVGMSETEMLACVIYQEVGGNMHCDMCRYRVADVVLNRVADERFPNTIYDVLMQQGQYGKFYWTGIKWADRASNIYEAPAVERAWKTAEDVMAGNHSDVYGEGYVYQAGFTQGVDGFWCCGHFFGR